MDAIIYHGKLNIEETVKDHYKKINEYMEAYYENEVEYCKGAILRPSQKEYGVITFSIPFDNGCTLQTFEKEILKVLSLVEILGKCVIKDGYINAFVVFHIEDPIQYKYIVRRNQKLSIVKQTFKRDHYLKMKNHLKKNDSTFYQSIFQE